MVWVGIYIVNENILIILVREFLDFKNRRLIKMPLRDRTGPRGLGPRTGRGLGECHLVEKEKKKDVVSNVVDKILGR